MPTVHRNLTDAFLRALVLKPGSPRAIADTQCPGLKVVVASSGRATYRIWKRFPGKANPTGPTLGKVGVMSLADARDKCRAWDKAIKAGTDPRELERQKKEQEEETRAVTVAAVWADYARIHLSKKRSGRKTAQDVERDVLPLWGTRPITEITRKDIRQLLDKLIARAPHAAHHIFSALSGFLNWCVNREKIPFSPMSGLKRKHAVGSPVARQRVLSNDELYAFWRASGRLCYPLGPFLRLTLLSGGRHSEISQARWREVDLKNRTLTIPPERTGGEFLFSFTDGKGGAGCSAKNKYKLDRRMLRTLKALARTRGDDPSVVELPHFVVHDLRRTVRTRLSALRITSEIAEMVIGHGKKGLDRVYNQHEYADEIREALEKWGKALMTIVEPPPTADNIVVLPKRKRR
jgi:integrase